MSETPGTAASAAKNVTKVAVTKPVAENVVDNLNKVLPTVVETAEVALEVPSKVVVNERLVFIVGVVAGAALGVGILVAVNKLRERNLREKIKKAAEATIEAVEAKNPKS